MKCFQGFKEIDQILLMEKTPAPVEVGSFSHYFPGFFCTSQVLFSPDFRNSINSILEEGTPRNTRGSTSDPAKVGRETKVILEKIWTLWMLLWCRGSLATWVGSMEKFGNGRLEGCF